MSDDLDLLRSQRSVWMSALDAECKLLALALLDHWSRRTETFPSLERLSAWTSLSRSTVIRSLQVLEREGALVVTRRSGRPNVYALGQLSLLPVSARHQCHRDTSVSLTPEPVSQGHPTSVSLTPEGTQEGTQEGTHTAARATDSPTKGVPKRKRARQPETALPPGWQPTEEHRAYAAKHGLQLQFEVDGFRGWAEGRTAVSWNGTFATRLSNQAKWNRDPKRRAGKTPVQRGGTIREASADWLDRSAE